MFLFSRCTAAGIVALVTTACAQDEITAEKKISYATSFDPGGCLVEHIAVDTSRGQFHFDGLSPDGSKLAVGWDRNGEQSGLYLLDLYSGARTEIPNLNNGAVFSPDGNKLLNIFPTENGRTDIVEYDLATGEMTTIAPHDNWEWLASYSSDGELILFNSYRTGASDIYTYRQSDGALKRWTDFEGYEAHAQFSPNDSKILFNRQDDGEDYNLYVIDTETGNISQLTDEATEEGYASWSPDGDTVVFASDHLQATGETDLYLINSDGENVRRITDHPAKDEYPFFSPDGRYIYFNSYRSDPKGLYRIELDSDLNCVKSAS
ncbi:MAG: PD40 domain-containing protein [Marinicaulis sp.]|nr:PD40 domain-containing protein [Marinicaulis sp.]